VLEPSEIAIQERLQRLGYEVVLKDSGSVAVEDTFEKAVVFIAPNASSTSIGTKLTYTSTPLINCRAPLSDDLGLGVGGFNTSLNEISILPTNPVHPLSSGFTGTLAVYWSDATIDHDLGWATPPASATKIAVLSNNASRTAIFGNEAGSALNGFLAPGRRVGFFLSEAGCEDLNLSGCLLVHAAVNWLDPY
jgi:hypothetical protein